MNRYGAAGGGGYNPEVVVAYLDSLRSHGVVNGRERQLLNGRPVSANDARVIRRWRNQASALSRKGLDRILTAHGLDVEAFERWAKRRKLNPRGHLTRPR